MSRLLIFNIISSTIVALSIPFTIYLINGVAEPWAFILGAIGAYCWWFFRWPIL